MLLHTAQMYSTRWEGMAYLRNEIEASNLWIPLGSGLGAGILAEALEIQRVNF